MSRSTWFRVYALAAIAVAVAASAWSVAGRTWPQFEELSFFALLVAVACYLRIDEEASTAGFEAAVVFAALPLLHDPAVATFSVFAGAMVHNVYGDIARKRLRLISLYDAAQLTLAYAVSGALYTSAVARDAPMMARVSGYVLLLIGYLTIDLIFRAVRRNRELSILTESAGAILSAEGEEETLRRMVTLVGRLARLKACVAVTWAPNPETPPSVFHYGACTPRDRDVLRWVESAGFAQSAPSRAFVFQDEQRRFPLSEGNAIQVLIGIQTAEVIYGMLIYETEEAAILRGGSLTLLTLLVNETALSLQDQLLRREMSGVNAQLVSQAATQSMILEVANGLIGSFDVDALLTRIAQAVRASLGFDAVVFALYDDKRDEFVRRAHAGLDDVWDEMRGTPVSPAQIRPFFDQQFRVLNSFFVSHSVLQQSEQGVFVRRDDEPLPRVDDWHENDILIVPLMSGDKMIGYLAVRDPQDRHVPTLEKVQTLEIFAVQAVTALQSARQYDEIKRLTIIDDLTSAFNHRHFQDALEKEIHRHERTGHDFAL